MIGYSPGIGDVLLLEFPVWDRPLNEHHQKVEQRVARELEVFTSQGLSPETWPQGWPGIEQRTRARHETCWEMDHRIGAFSFVGESLGRIVGYRYWRSGSLSTPYVKWPRCRVPYQLNWIGKFHESDARRDGADATVALMRQAVEAELSERYAQGCWVDWSRWHPEPMVAYWFNT